MDGIYDWWYFSHSHPTRKGHSLKFFFHFFLFSRAVTESEPFRWQRINLRAFASSSSLCLEMIFFFFFWRHARYFQFQLGNIIISPFLVCTFLRIRSTNLTRKRSFTSHKSICAENSIFGIGDMERGATVAYCMTSTRVKKKNFLVNSLNPALRSF